MSRLAPLSFFSPSFDSPPTAPTASSSWERDRLRSPCSQFRPANSEANVSERREDDRAGGEKGRGLRCLSRSEWPTGASPSHKEETEESGHREREDDRERKENSLQCIRGTEEELQVLAARVLQRLPYPQMLSIDDVCKEMIRLDLNVISKGLIYLSRGLPKALANSRLLFVGSKDACERELQAEEERKERERRQQQHQEDEEERRRRGVSHFTRKQPGRRRGRRTRGIEEKTKKHSCRFEEQERGNEADQEKSFSENSCCQNTASSSSTTEQETEEEEGTEEDEELDDDDDDEVEWFNTPLRDEQASCYPWLLPPRSPAPHRNIDRDGSSAKSSSSCSSPPSPTAENALYVLLRPYISPAEEVFGRGDLLVILCSFLDVRDVVNVGRVCRGTVESSLSDDVWLALLKRKFPRASLVHEDVLKDADLKTQLSANQQKEIIDALLVQIPPDAPTSLSKLLLIANRTMNQLSFSSSSDGRRSLRRTHYVLKMDIESLLHLLSCHPRLFKQDAAGEQFVVSPSLIYDDWLCVNPYAVLGGGANGSGGDPEKRKREIEEQVREDLAKEEEEEQADEENEDRQKRGDSFMTGHDGDQPSGSSSASFEHEGRYLFRRDLTPRQAYRLWSTQLIGPDQNKNRPWEYHSESNHRGTLPAGHLLDLCENRVRFIRRGDPTAVHMLTVRTLEGIAYHIRTGCYNRRVNILQQALCSPHLRLEREVRKRFERKLLELMQYVKQERKFGYYQCKGCSARWRSGFTYDEIRQQCLKCFLWNKPFKLQPLLASSSSSQSAGVAAATPHTPGASLSTWQNRHRHRGESHSCHSSHINNRTREEMHNSSLASPQSLYREDRTEGGNEYRRRRGGGGGINQRTLAPASPCLVDSTPEPSAGRGNEFSHGSKLNDHRKNKGISPRPFNQQRGPSFLSLAYPSLRRQEERRSGHQDGDRHNNSYVSSSTLYSSFRSKKERQNDRRSQQDSSYTGAASSTSHRRAPEQLPGGHESRLTGAWPGQYQEARDANAKNTSVIHYKTLEEEKTHGGPSGCVGGGQTCSSHPGEGSDGSYGQTSEKTRGENGPVAHHSARGGGRRTRRLPGPPVKGVEVRGVPPRPGRQPFQENQTRHVFCEDDENGRGKITEGCGVPLLQLHEEYTSSALLNSINTEGPFKIQDSYRGDWISSHRTERQGLIATPMTIPKSSAGLLPYHPPSRHSPHHPLSPARPSTRRPLLHRGWESGGHGAGPELMHHSQPEARRQQGEEEACLFSSSLLSSSLMPSSGTLTGRDSSFCVRQQIEGRNSHSTRRGGGRGGGRGRRFLPPFTS